MKPIIHLNGSNADALQDALREAATAVGVAREKVALTAPNQRDYYPATDNAWECAVSEYRQWVADLDRIYDGLLATFQHIDEVTS